MFLRESKKVVQKRLASKVKARVCGDMTYYFLSSHSFLAVQKKKKGFANCSHIHDWHEKNKADFKRIMWRVKYEHNTPSNMTDFIDFIQKYKNFTMSSASSLLIPKSERLVFMKKRSQDG